MRSDSAPSNHTFYFLKNSSSFLKLLLEEINSCILLLNKELMLYAFNEPFRTIFSDKPDEMLLLRKCGEVIGCAYTVEEQKECGLTSNCMYCPLREAALKTCYTHVSSGKLVMSREFYKDNGTKALKHLRFSTRYFSFENEGFIVVILDDVTDIVRGEINWIKE